MSHPIPAWRIVDLVPRKLATLAVLALAGVVVIGGLESLYWATLRWSSLTSDGRVAAFDLDGEGSLAAWFSSTVLLAAGLASLLVFAIRRNKVDDYAARYRIWLWAGLAFLMMGIDEAASLHEGFKELLSHLAGSRLLGDGSLWWVAAYLLVLVPLGLRLMLEIRTSRVALASLIGVAVAFALAVVAQLEWIPGLGVVGSTMLEEGAEMAGDVLLLVAILAYARHALLVAEGQVSEQAARPSRRRRRKAAAVESSAAAEESYDEDEVRVSATPRTTSKPATESRPAASRPVVTSSAQVPARPAGITRTDAAHDELEGPHKLSKAERKALRRQSRSERDEW